MFLYVLRFVLNRYSNKISYTLYSVETYVYLIFNFSTKKRNTMFVVENFINNE